MDRRTFLIGLSGTAVAGGALVGSGAFSRVESQRDVTVQVAEDPNAYLGLSGTGSPNSDNYVSIDDNGHLAIDISSHDDFSGPDTEPGDGVNSDSFTYFDGMVEVCNQGKEDVGFYVEPPTDDDFPGGIDATGPDGTPYADEPRLQFYTGEAALDGDAGTDTVMGEANAETVLLGECIELGVRVMTKGIDASDDTGIDQLFDEEVRLVADVTKLSTPDRTVYNPDQDEFFQDLQTAIDDADPGDTIQVLEGTSFNTNLSITKPITLVATSNTKPAIVADPTVDTSAIEIDGVDDVTIDDFRITFDGTQSPNGEKYGIRALADSNGLTVRNCIIGGFSTEWNGQTQGAIRATGVTVTAVQGSAAPATVETPTIENCLFEDIECRGSVPDDGVKDDDSKAKGVAMNGDVQDATIEECGFFGIGTASNSPDGTAEQSRPTNNVEGTHKTRGISLTEDSDGVGPTNFQIVGNVFGGPGGNQLAGTFGQPAIFVGGTDALGPDHQVESNEFYHPVDNLSADGLQVLSETNTWEDEFDTSESGPPLPNTVPPDQDQNGGNLIDRGEGAYVPPDLPPAGE